MKTPHPAATAYGARPPRRTYTSTREAFADERFPAVFGPYRPHMRFLNAALWAVSVVVLVLAFSAPALWEVFG